MEQGHRKRVRDKLFKSGRSILTDVEICEVLLFSAIPRRDVKPLAKKLIGRFGSYAKLLSASVHDLKEVEELNDQAVSLIMCIQESVERILKSKFTNSTVLNNWHSLVDYLRISMGHRDTECHRILYLNTKYALIQDDLHEYGTIDETRVYIREIVARALQLKASKIVIAHNHPSGDHEPSKADAVITQQLISACETVGVELVDHVIVSQTGHFSFKSNNLM